jgi:hypothetical protein
MHNARYAAPAALLVSTLLSFMLLTSLLVASAAEAARRPAWVKLGSTSVSDRVDRDTIAVTARRGNFEALQIRVSERDVQFREVAIRFANGDLQNVELRNVIRAGGQSRIIDIEGRDRVIRAIELVYDAQALGGKSARVEVWGRH